jgi:cell shape-determining protein MreD
MSYTDIRAIRIKLYNSYPSAIVVALLFLFLEIRIMLGDTSYMVPNAMVFMIFFSSIQSRDYISIIALLILSIIEDVYMDLPIGSMAICYLLLKIALHKNKRYITGKSFCVQILGFLLAYIIFVAAREIIIILTYDLNQLDLKKLVSEILLIVCYYPFIHNLINNRLFRPDAR